MDVNLYFFIKCTMFFRCTTYSIIYYTVYIWDILSMVGMKIKFGDSRNIDKNISIETIVLSKHYRL